MPKESEGLFRAKLRNLGAGLVHGGLMVGAHYIHALSGYHPRFRNTKHSSNAAEVLIAKISPGQRAASRGDIGKALGRAQPFAASIFGVVERDLAHTNVFDINLQGCWEGQIPIGERR